ncbi:hypothetical protein [Nocardia sp. NBC_01009]|uniref:hypothetical protein n=1 Tax=Nocardia sp. NBC_01009 TaxID=2975996 RepID=UPI00386C567C|nr:hypothetical protein OHA42_18560 [Nocardia sp. NBC_01009]
MTINLGPEGWVPDSCTLPTVEQPVRVAEFDGFFASSVRGSTRPQRTRLDLAITDGAEPVGRDLAAQETACCSFFTFTFDTGETGPVMRIEVPPARVEVLDAFEQRAAALAAAGEHRVAQRAGHRGGGGQCADTVPLLAAAGITSGGVALPSMSWLEPHGVTLIIGGVAGLFWARSRRSGCSAENGCGSAGAEGAGCGCTIVAAR